MAVETRFARTPSGPVAYRVDGSGDAQLMIISDWAAPYGAPGRGRFEAFVAELGRRGVQTITLLDGIAGTAQTPPSAMARAESASRVAKAVEIDGASLLGVADGGPVALRLAMRDGKRFGRLVLYDTFPPEAADAWNLEGEAAHDVTIPPAPPSADFAPPSADFSPPGVHLSNLASHIESATEAAGWARRFFERNKGSSAKAAGRRSSADRAVQPREALRWLTEQAPAELGPGGGLAELLENVARLESLGGQGPVPRPIRIPTLVLEAAGSDGRESEDAGGGGTLGLEVAARIGEARHRRVAGSSRWPWGDSAIESQLLEPAVTAALPSPEAPPDAATAPGTAATAPATAAPGVLPEAARERVLATVLFTDIVGSTARLAELGDVEWRNLLERHHHLVRSQLVRHGGREVDTAGDGFLAAFDIPARGVRCAAAIRDALREIGVTIRCGLHTGECERVGDKLVGIAVHIGARIAAQANGGEILVSATVRDLVAGSGITFEDRGTATLKGLSGEWALYLVDEVS